MSAPSHMIASLDAALAEYTAGIDRAVRFVTIDQVDMLTEFYLHNRRTPDPAQIRADAIRDLAEIIRDWRNSIPMTGEECANAILALLATPLSPTAVDDSIAPDAGTKGQDQ